jgi:hypothetical protein
MPELVPHPLVAALAQGLGKGSGEFLDLYTGARTTGAFIAETPTNKPSDDRRQAPDRGATEPSDPDDLAQALANDLARDTTLRELVAFAGFLGGRPEDDSRQKAEWWRLLYFDPKLLTWMLVKENDILLRCAVKDETVPFERRDVIWVESDATVSRGSGAPRQHELQARHLRGDFVRAEDFVATLSGGTFAPAAGLLGEVYTPGCCGRPTRH